MRPDAPQGPDSLLGSDALQGPGPDALRGPNVAYDKDYEADVLAAVDRRLSGRNTDPWQCAGQWTGATVFTTWALHARQITCCTRTLTNFKALITVKIRIYGKINRQRVCHMSSLFGKI